MHLLTHLTIGLISLITIVLSCILFTNAIEFLGNKIKLGNNATGSILAVIGTGLPETIIPFVAIFGRNISNIQFETAQEIVAGAIIGSPFILSTLALFLLFIILVAQKRKNIVLEYKNIIRDYKYFLIAYSFMFLYISLPIKKYYLFAVIFLLILYFLFAYKTIIKSRTTCIECECESLFLNKNKKHNENFTLTIQLIFSMLVLIISSHFFVNEINYFSNILNVSPLILSLLITPIATELPEITNSIIWIKEQKDELAFANILGAIVFQTTILFSLGILLIQWIPNKIIMTNMLLTLVCSLFFVFSIIRNGKIKFNCLIVCGITFLFFLIMLIIN